MIDRIEQIYECPFYQQSVYVKIERSLCERSQCPEPQPHILGQYFVGCSDILKCGVGELKFGQIIAPNMHLCPAHATLKGDKEL